MALAEVSVPSDPANLPQIAGLYSQLAGVLAGFAFAAVMALAVAQVTQGTQSSHAFESFVPLVGAFVGLVASSLNYAIVAGEVAGTARIAELRTVAGFGFSVSGMMLFLSILILLRGLHADLRQRHSKAPTPPVNIDVSKRAADVTRGIIGGLFPLLVGLLYGGLRDHLDLVYGPVANGLRWPDYVAFAILLAALVDVGWTVRTKYSDLASCTSTTPLKRITVVSVIFMLVSLLGTNVLIPFVPRTTPLPDPVSLSFVVLFAVFGSWLHRIAAVYRSP